MTPGAGRTVEGYFAGHPEGLQVFRAVERAVRDLGEVEVRVGRSQVAFRRRTGFAYVWRPAQYVRSDVPAVLSIALPHRIDDARWKQVAHPAPKVWMHHLEMPGPAALDDQVRGWLAEAYSHAG